MKIKKTASELKIEVHSHFLVRFWGCVFIVAGLFFLLPMIVQYKIICKDKGYNKANDCRLNTNFLKIYNRNLNLGVLKSATVSSYIEGRSNAVSYFLLLNTAEGYVKIPSINSKKNIDIVYVVDAIENYIKTSLNKSINIPKVESWFSYFKIAIFPLLGVGSLFFRLYTINFNRNTKTVTIFCKNIINTRQTKISLNDVEKLIIEAHGQKHKQYSLALLLKNGEHIELTGLHDSSLEQIEELAQRIKPFLISSSGEKN